MTKSQLIDIVAKQAHLPKKAAKEAVDALFDEISRALVKGDKVVISGFGTFYTNKVSEKAVEPFGDKTKRRIIESHSVVNFKTGEPLRQAVW